MNNMGMSTNEHLMYRVQRMLYWLRVITATGIRETPLTDYAIKYGVKDE